jgi:hypothetical protein
VKDAADHAAIIHTILAAHVRRQMRLDLPPLLIIQPKQIASHRANSRITKVSESSTDSAANTFIGCGP